MEKVKIKSLIQQFLPIKVYQKYDKLIDGLTDELHNLFEKEERMKEKKLKLDRRLFDEPQVSKWHFDTRSALCGMIWATVLALLAMFLARLVR